MTAVEFKVCTAMAQDLTVDVSGFDYDALFGCGLPEFSGARVPAGAVARFLRYQCLYLNGGWDWDEYAQCRVIMLRKGARAVELSELSAADSRDLVLRICDQVLAK